MKCKLTLWGIALFIALFDSFLLYSWLPNTVFTTVDTPGYWRFVPIRTAGYPTLLHMFAVASDGFHDLVLFQFLVAACATVLLCHAILTVFRSACAAIFAAVILTIKQGLVNEHLSLMTDSLFFSCCTIIIALAMLTLARPSWRLIGATAVALSAATLLRPAVLGIVWPELLVSLILWQSSRPRFALGILATVPVGLCANLAAHPIAARIVGDPGAGAGAMAGLSLMGTAGFLLTAETPTKTPELRDRLVPEFAPFRAAWLDAKTLQDQFFVLLPQADDLLYNHAIPVVCKVLQHPCRNRLSTQVEGTLAALAIEAIEHDPRGMLRIIEARLVIDAEWSLSGDWIIAQDKSFQMTKDSYTKYNFADGQFSTNHYLLEARESEVAPDLLGVSGWIDRHRMQVNESLTLMCLASFGLASWCGWTRRWSPDLATIGIAGIGSIAYNVLISIGQSPFGRYNDAIAGWLLVVAIGIILVAARGLRLSMIQLFGLGSAVLRQALVIPTEPSYTRITAPRYRVAILLPDGDDAAVIGETAASFRAALPEARIYVGQDYPSAKISTTSGGEAGSTGDIARRMFREIEADFYILLTTDAAYDIDDTVRLLDRLAHDKIDLINGRRIPGADSGMRIGQRLGTLALARLAGLMFGKRLDDILSGCKVMSRRFVKSFPGRSAGLAIEAEIVLHASELMLPIAEGQVKYREGRRSVTSVSGSLWLVFAMVNLILRLAWLRRPGWLFGTIGATLALLSIQISRPIFHHYWKTGLVPRLPAAMLCGALMLLAGLSVIRGSRLERATRERRERKHRAYRELAAATPTCPEIGT